jgi:prolyl-tRNA synthetase
MVKEKDKKGLTAKKSGDFSEWFSQIVKKAELADLRYNIKGFLVFQPWSVLAMEKMYAHLERVLRRKGHKPYFFPTLIPESNLKKEKEHVEKYAPEVFWVTEAGNKKLDERLALRPTSETAFYQMFALWIRSYKDLPFKAYQKANMFRYDTKATRPFLRGREFHWVETHCAHASEKSAMAQVKEDMETTEEVLHGVFGLPFMFFERPSWDKFGGASKTFAADVLNPDGKVVQQPSTHLLVPEFAKAFDISFKDKDGKTKNAYTTCYGPAISRIFASVVIMHGDDKGLRFPWEIAPLQMVIVPVSDDAGLMKKAESLKKKLENIGSVEVDMSERRAGEKFNHWEMKGVPVRIDLGLKDLKKKKVTVFRRDLNKKEVVSEGKLVEVIKKIAKESCDNLRKEADKLFKGRIRESKNIKEMKKVLSEGGIARCGFCSVEKEGVSCAEIIEKDVKAEVRGKRLDEKGKAIGKCVVCGKKAKEIVYVARAY